MLAPPLGCEPAMCRQQEAAPRMGPHSFLMPGLAARLQAEVCAQHWRPRGLALAGVWPCLCCPPCATGVLAVPNGSPLAPGPSLSVTSQPQSDGDISSGGLPYTPVLEAGCLLLPRPVRLPLPLCISAEHSMHECWLRAVPM